MDRVPRARVIGLVAGLTFAGCVAMLAGGMPEWLKVDASGAMNAAGVRMGVTHYDGSWGSHSQSPGAVRVRDGAAPSGAELWRAGLDFSVNGGTIKLDETLSLGKNGVVDCSYKAACAAPLPTKELSLSMALPIDGFCGKSVLFDDKAVALPPEYSEKDWQLFSKNGIKRIVIQTMTGKLVLSGDFSALLQDNRKFSGSDYGLRIKFPVEGDSLTESSLSISMALEGFDASPVDISKQVNMGFADEVGDDGKGGWTDQGPENDLRMIKPGRLMVEGIPVEILDPARNGGKSCVVLAGTKRPQFPVAVDIPVNGASMKNVYLLHALAWPPSGDKPKAGKIVIGYADGSSSSVDVIAGDSVANWWQAGSIANASVAWTGENASSYVGLYLAKYPVEPKPVASIRLESTQNSVWMIVGVTSSKDDIPLRKTAPFYVVKSDEWKPIEFPRDVEPGSVLDLSFLLDGPAGKHGRMIANDDGHLAFESDKSKAVRLYGGNLCFTSNFPDKELADKLADRLARNGYNTIRFHHFDNQLAARKDGRTTALDPANLDKFEYLFSRLKAKGIYITIDLYISRALEKGEITEAPQSGRDGFKGMVPVYESAMKNWELFSKNLLEHVNPHTGIAWKDDPALISISLVNEDTIFAAWNATPELTATYEALFAEWLKAKGGEAPATGPVRERLFKQFLVDTYNKAYARMSAFVRSLGAKVLLSDQNMFSTVPMALMRRHYDYVDNHYYFEHPHFTVKPWSLPSAIAQGSATAQMAIDPCSTAPSRLFGKPMMITEFNYPYPNKFRGEGGVLTAAVAALQGWDALYRFAFSHRLENLAADTRCEYFDNAADPINTLSDKIGVMLFLRGDVAPSKVSFPFVLPEKYLESETATDNYPAVCRLLSLVGKTGTVVVADGACETPKDTAAALCVGMACGADGKCAVPRVDVSKSDRKGTIAEDTVAKLKEAGGLGGGELRVADGYAKSSTGQIECDKTKGFKVVTPASEVFVMLGKGNCEGTVTAVANDDGPAVVAVTSLDGKPIAGSGRLLALHLTDVQDTKSKFADKDMKTLLAYGVLPHLVRKGTATLSLKGLGDGTPSAWAVDMAGKRIAEAPVTRVGDAWTLPLATHRPDGSCMAYEIEVKR